MLYPISLNLKDKTAVVIGAGPVAMRKINFLAKAEAHISVIAEKFDPRIISSEKITCHQKKYRSTDISSAFLVIAATDSKEVNDQIAKDCQEKNILFSCIKKETPSDFYVSALIERGDLQVTVSTSGKVPGASRSLKMRLDKNISNDWSEFLEYLNNTRDQIKTFEKSEEQKMLIRKISSEKVINLFEEQGLQQAKKMVEEIMASHE